MGREGQAVVIAYPQQGHVAPLMKLSLKIAAHGVKVTFVNTEFIHSKLMAASSSSSPCDDDDERERERSPISCASLPDGLDSEDDRTDYPKMTDSINQNMPTYFEDYLVGRINDDEHISCVIADTSLGWAFQVAKKLGIEAVAVCPYGGASLALALHVPQLLDAQIIDHDGIVLKDAVSISKDMPCWRSSEIGWKSSNPIVQKSLLSFFHVIPRYAEFHDWLLCNSVYELDSAALNLAPNVLSIGPLLASNYLDSSFPGNFWPEDSTCLDWLDQQASNSVIYVAFGSSTKAGMQQLEEIALGLELTGQPFLWVVRSNLMNGSHVEFPDGFLNRVAKRAKFVEWAPQEKVLAHSSVACFMSHCGWNSTMEGLSMGIPFICWPYFADQFTNKNYICDVWKIGLGLVQDENGIITRHEISSKINTLLSSDVIRANALHVKELAKKSINEGGSSFNNFNKFIEHIKAL